MDTLTGTSENRVQGQRLYHFGVVNPINQVVFEVVRLHRRDRKHYGDERQNLELKDYGRILRRSWAVIATCTLLGVLAAAGISLLVTPTYSARAQLFVAIQNSGSAAELQQSNTFTQSRVQSYVETVSTPSVLQPAIESLGLPDSAEELAQRVSASADLQTVIITITASDASPAQAAAIAQAVTDSLVEVVRDLESPGEGGTSPIKLSVVTPAAAPVEPSSPNISQNLALGLLIGLATGLGIAAIRSMIDTKIRNEADLAQATDTPVLGGVAFSNDAISNPLVSQVGGQSPRGEAFRQIRTNLQFANVNRKSKSILVTSSVPGEGKSTTATNLAVTMAQSGQRVVLVDADLRRPMLASYLGIERSAGLTTALVGSARLQDLLQPWGNDGLVVLASGSIPPNPSELLGSEAMTDVIEQLEQMFDAVIIDAPPLLPVTDGSVLAQKVGGVVIVVGANKIKTHELERTFSSLALVNANVLGVVMNLLPTKGPDAYAYSYYSYETKPHTEHGYASHSNSLEGRQSASRRARSNKRRTTVR